MTETLRLAEVVTPADRRRFVDLVFTLYKSDPSWVPPLKSEMIELISTVKTNPWFEHGHAKFWIAYRGDTPVGRISAQVDTLVLEHVAPDLGHWGMFECIDDLEVAKFLISAAEDWLRSQGMKRAQGPFSISIWDEVGLLVDGFDRAPTVMMGHHLPYYAGLIEACGYAGVKDLYTYELDVTRQFPDIIQKIVSAGERNSHIRVRQVDKSKFAQEAALILDILNDAWSVNWGFTPLTPLEVAHVGKKLKPLVYEDLIQIAEYDGEPVAFMIALPDLNEFMGDLGGSLFPFGWAKLLWRLHKPRTRRIRVPLMGVRKRLQGTRTASMLAFMLIEYIRRNGVANYGGQVGEIGWILDDNGPMRSIANAIDSNITRTYRIYERTIG
jgi:hypothetical protein